MRSFDEGLLRFLDDPLNVAAAAGLAIAAFLAFLYGRQVWFTLRFVAKSLSRNLVRTSLTALATAVLVLVVTLVWSIFALLDRITADKARDLKAIITEKLQVPSQMPMSYADDLCEGAPATPQDYRVPPRDSMTWSFYVGNLDKEKPTRENIIFFFGMEPGKVLTMMDNLDEITPQQRADLEAAFQEMEKDKRKVVVGIDRLKALQKQVGDRFTVKSTNYKDIDLEVEVIAAFPDGGYNQNAIMNRDYLRDALDDYKNKHGGTPHPQAQKTLNLAWVRVPDKQLFQKVTAQIESSSKFTSPKVRCETASSAVSSFLEAYSSLLWGMRWLLVPALLCTMSLVIANAISISVRERRGEMAVLKVLGFSPGQVMMLVLGEALLVGVLSGVLSAGGTYLYVNLYKGGFRFPIGFIPTFKIPVDAWWWGAAVGGLTALAGSLLPSWSARSVKVSEVFSKVS